MSYCGKVAVHPTPLTNLTELFERTTVGPVPGQIVMLGGLLFHGTWLAIALITLQVEKRHRRPGALIAIA